MITRYETMKGYEQIDPRWGRNEAMYISTGFFLDTRCEKKLVRGTGAPRSL